jgi:hypothetical protein
MPTVALARYVSVPERDAPPLTVVIGSAGNVVPVAWIVLVSAR